MKLFLIGLFSGIIGGMGIGGGTILIPALTIIMGVEQHTAQSVNLLSFIPTAVIALIYHLKKRNIKYSILPLIITGGIIGSLVGANIAIVTKAILLKKIFAILLFSIGIYEILSKPRK
ncbi:sulfite exporter TauE/SafE family protein [Caldanaerobacter subterraneus]|uniref:Probable membrane transporter protein n=1 Tax=Caldanaerobacter subterraneus TaxID=911092 RepID=A0A7Y2L978_9THEO|nr:sulfite exporter TauE/SafE family protein [Caldanaerobacter subterraneus]NNG68128.1 sulfite exporter TauE/SafE family protein [Caldanaerobacter subterraneus]